MRVETLVTGAASGLGRYLLSRANVGAWPGPATAGLTRDNSLPLLKDLRAKGTGTIIHCAFDRAPSARAENISLTERLLEIPHDRFVLVSSSDVYTRFPADESSPIDLTRERTPYAQAKALCEERVFVRASRPLVLRPSSLLGSFSKPSNLSRLLNDAAPELTLTADSSWNVVLHEDVRQFLEKAVRAGLSGIYNLASGSSIRVDELAARLGRTPRYGEFRYEAGHVLSSKAAAVHEAFAQSSWEQIQRVLMSKDF